MRINSVNSTINTNYSTNRNKDNKNKIGFGAVVFDNLPNHKLLINHIRERATLGLLMEKLKPIEDLYDASKPHIIGAIDTVHKHLSRVVEKLSPDHKLHLNEGKFTLQNGDKEVTIKPLSIISNKWNSDLNLVAEDNEIVKMYEGDENIYSKLTSALTDKEHNGFRTLQEDLPEAAKGDDSFIFYAYNRISGKTVGSKSTQGEFKKIINTQSEVISEVNKCKDIVNEAIAAQNHKELIDRIKAEIAPKVDKVFGL